MITQISSQIYSTKNITQTIPHLRCSNISFEELYLAHLFFFFRVLSFLCLPKAMSFVSLLLIQQLNVFTDFNISAHTEN